MNGDIKKYIYLAGTVFIAVFAMSIIFKLLKWLILAGIVIFIVTKIVGFIKGKSKGKEFNNDKKNNNIEYSYKGSTDSYDNGEIIDVEYEDVDDKRK